MSNKLFIFRMDEDGDVSCSIIEPTAFDKWYKDHTEGVDERYLPRFSNIMPEDVKNDWAPEVFYIIKGEIVMPRVKKVVTEMVIE